MLTFSLGVAIGFLIKPAIHAYADYDWYRNFEKCGVKQSIAKAFNDIWS